MDNGAVLEDKKQRDRGGLFMPDGAISVRYLTAITQLMFCSGQHCTLLQFNRGGKNLLNPQKYLSPLSMEKEWCLKRTNQSGKVGL